MRKLDLPAAGDQFEYYVNDRGQRVFTVEPDDIANPTDHRVTTRKLWDQAVDQLLASEAYDYDSGHHETYWPLTDHQGTVRHVYSIAGYTDKAEHTEYDAFGRPNLVESSTDGTAEWYVDSFQAGREYDDTPASTTTGAVVRSGVGTIPQRGKQRRRVQRLHLRRELAHRHQRFQRERGGRRARLDRLLLGKLHLLSQSRPQRSRCHGQCLHGREVRRLGNGCRGRISAAAVGGTAIAGGATVSSLFSAGTVGAGVYFGKNAIVAGVETGIEASIAYATRDDSFNAAYAFGRNFAINSVIGFMPGVAEGKIAAKAGRLGFKLGARFGDDAARWGYKTGRYAVHAGRDIALGTAADTAWAVGIEGRSVGNAVTQSFVGNFAGQGVGDLLSTGIRRVMPHITSPGRICFAAGTLVQLADAETEAAFVPIEKVRLGGRVHTDGPLDVAASISAQRACHVHSHPDSTVASTAVVSDFSDGPTSQFDSSQWRVLFLRPITAADSDVEVTLLRPLLWLSAQDAFPGSVLYLDLPELNTSGPMRVESIHLAPPIQPDPGGLVTGTFRHTAHELAEVRLERLDEPIRCTPRHPFWSDARKGWVAASELQPGDALLSATGAITTVRSIFLEGPTSRSTISRSMASMFTESRRWRCSFTMRVLSLQVMEHIVHCVPTMWRQLPPAEESCQRVSAARLRSHTGTRFKVHFHFHE